MPSNRVDQITVPGALKNHERRLQTLERFVGRWSYVLPIAPGNVPPDYDPDDPYNVPFQNSWANLSGGQPLRFRNFPATKVEIIGAVTGGTAPSIVFTLPNSSFFPPNDTPILFPSTDGSATWQGLIDTSGNVWIISQCSCEGEGGGTVTDVTSGDDSILVTDGTTTPDLSVQNSPAVGGVIVTGTPTVGQLLTATGGTAADWEDPPASGSWPNYTGSGSPAGVVDAAAKGDTYGDTDSGAIWIARQTGTGGWMSVGGFVDEPGAFGVLLDDDSSGEWQVFDPVSGFAGLAVQSAAAASTPSPPAYTSNSTLDDGSGNASFDGQVDAVSLGPTIPYVTLQVGAPSTYQTPLVFDTTAITGGLYGWDGSVYQKIGGPL